MHDDVDLSALNVEQYDFDGLRNDVASILDIQAAVLTTLKWTLLVPVAGTFIARIVFSDRIAGWLLWPYLLILALTLVLAAINVGLMFVLRNRIAETNAAADRVLTMTAALHGDYLKVKSGEVNVPMKAIAGILTRELVFPALFAGGHNVAAAATTAAGPMGWIGARLLKYPLRAVERRVLDVLESDELEPHEVQDTATQPLAGEGGEGSEIIAAALTPTFGDSEVLDDFYKQAFSIVHRVVSGAGTVATGSLGTVLMIAALPLVIWLAFGWFVL